MPLLSDYLITLNVPRLFSFINIFQNGDDKEYAYKYIGDLEDTVEPNKMDNWYNRFVAAKVRNTEAKGENLTASFSKLGGDMFQAGPDSITNE